MEKETTKFSLGQVIALIALMFTVSIIFMGIVYLSNGNFKLGIEVSVAAFLLLLVASWLPQMFKGASHNFQRNSRLEAFSLALYAVVAVATFIPYSHFWTVLGRSAELSRLFNGVIDFGRNLFTDYEGYANSRIASFEEYTDANVKKERHRENLKYILRLQLLPPDYQKMRKEAFQWMDKAGEGCSVWNVFLLGNMKEIEASVLGWNEQLVTLSKPRLLAEKNSGKVALFEANASSLQPIISRLEDISKLYSTLHFPGLPAIFTGLLCYLLMLFPYYLQPRNPKSRYKLFDAQSARKNSTSKKPAEAPTASNAKSKSGPTDKGTFTLD